MSCFSFSTISQLKSTMDLRPRASWYSFQRWPTRTGFVLGRGSNWNSVIGHERNPSDYRRRNASRDARAFTGRMMSSRQVPLGNPFPAGEGDGERMVLTREPRELLALQDLGRNALALGILLPLDIAADHGVSAPAQSLSRKETTHPLQPGRSSGKSLLRGTPLYVSSAGSLVLEPLGAMAGDKRWWADVRGTRRLSSGLGAPGCGSYIAVTRV